MFHAEFLAIPQSWQERGCWRKTTYIALQSYLALPRRGCVPYGIAAEHRLLVDSRLGLYTQVDTPQRMATN